jgi:multiple sugar transport system ATP-binding protein
MTTEASHRATSSENLGAHPPRGLDDILSAAFAIYMFEARLGKDSAVSLGGVTIALSKEAAATAADKGWQSVTVGFRPESLELAAEGIPARVEVVEEIGAEAHVFCATELEGETTKLVASVETRKAPKRGERIALKPIAAEAHLFDPETSTRL